MYYFSIKTYVVGTQTNRLDETVRLVTQIIWFFFKIYDGYPEANDVLGTYCGNNDDIDVSSTQSTLSVRFSSDYMTVRTGFTATYTPGTVLPAKSDSDVMFCLQRYQRLMIDR